MPSEPALVSEARTPPPRGRVVAVQFLVLAAMCVFAFRRAFTDTFRWAEWNPEAAHAFAAPVILVMLFMLRRRALALAISKGSWVGLLLIVLSLVGHFLVSWPFNYGLPRRLAVVPALAGCVLAVGGWRFMWRALPLLLVVAISIPPGARYYARLIVMPETLTLETTRVVLDLLPGVLVERDGLDLTFVHGANEGTIAKGVSNRGATLLMASLLVWVFVTYARIRPTWQVVVALLAAGPIVLLANLLRMVSWGMITIYGGAAPVEQMPRYASTIIGLVAAWVMTAALLWVLDHLMAAPEPDDAGASP